MSPTFKREKGFVFKIFSNEELRMHVHVFKEYCEAKIWLEPEVELCKQGDLTDKEIKEVLDIAESYKEELVKQWKNYMNGKLRMKIIKK